MNDVVTAHQLTKDTPSSKRKEPNERVTKDLAKLRFETLIQDLEL